MATEREYLEKRLAVLARERRHLLAAPRIEIVGEGDPVEPRLEANFDETAQVRRRMVEIDHLDADRTDQAQAEASAFWYRRFFTTLAIANGAAFLALANGFIQADDRSVLAPLIHKPMLLFALGTFAAGAIPLVLGAAPRLDRSARRTHANKSILIAVQGLVIAIGSGLVVASIVSLVRGAFEAVEAIRLFAG